MSCTSSGSAFSDAIYSAGNGKLLGNKKGGIGGVRSYLNEPLFTGKQ